MKNQSKSLAVISGHLSQLNSPAVFYTQKVLGVHSHDSYMTVKLEDNKVSVVSIRNTPFRLGDFILSKSIRKDIELSESAKEAEALRGSFGQPTIYKILKNCLKYADKVKPPEKLVK